MQRWISNSDFRWLGRWISRSGPSHSLSRWVFSDPEFQFKRRVASYKAYAVEGKVKGSVRRSFRWLKDKYSEVVYGFW
ncbi:hypothetical protein Cni_G02242 [Canna indica]|uniref:Uncharacterized protein n=1 Tax=Canna indica TaxID=4628 RepID=A0AAQ3JQM7_9LILI|nr:hypothetical protein Cni_G02242 [Canna indica]